MFYRHLSWNDALSSAECSRVWLLVLFAVSTSVKLWLVCQIASFCEFFFGKSLENLFYFAYSKYLLPSTLQSLNSLFLNLTLFYLFWFGKVFVTCFII